ncbi:unnamed protein product, partial [Ceratitis capitata]
MLSLEASSSSSRACSFHSCARSPIVLVCVCVYECVCTFSPPEVVFHVIKRVSRTVCICDCICVDTRQKQCLLLLCLAELTKLIPTKDRRLNKCEFWWFLKDTEQTFG